jgi:hypothetical protein
MATVAALLKAGGEDLAGGGASPNHGDAICVAGLVGEAPGGKAPRAPGCGGHGDCALRSSVLRPTERTRAARERERGRAMKSSQGTSEQGSSDQN